MEFDVSPLNKVLGEMLKKKRLDTLLTEKGFFVSRERAKAAILEGRIFVNGLRVDKAGTFVRPESEIKVKREAISYVSRGGVKLEKALTKFNVEVKGKVTLDVGASTGGFTDCLLKHGAKLVIAVDVGYGQFAWSLRQDKRVYLLERTNIRYLTRSQLPNLAEIVTVDLSFISVTKIIQNLKNLLTKRADLLLLIKPQFEVGKEFVGKKGVIRDSDIHRKLLARLWQHFEQLNFRVLGLTFSPLLGAEGNIEFWFYLNMSNSARTNKSNVSEQVNKVVGEAHRTLKNEKRKVKS